MEQFLNMARVRPYFCSAFSQPPLQRLVHREDYAIPLGGEIALEAKLKQAGHCKWAARGGKRGLVFAALLSQAAAKSFRRLGLRLCPLPHSTLNKERAADASACPSGKHEQALLVGLGEREKKISVSDGGE